MAAAGESDRGQDPDDLLVAAAAGRFARPDRGDGQRHQARARAGGRQGRPAHDQVRVARRLDGPGRLVDAGGGVRPTRSRPRRTSRPPSTSARSTRAPRRSRSRSSPRPAFPQISPANTYVGLTTNDPGSEPGEPDKYYPTGDRTYTRIVPKDTIQAAALVTLMKQDGCTKVAMTNDKEVYGAGLARVIELSAKEQGLELTAQRRDRQERVQLPLARRRRPRPPALTASCTRASPPTTRSSSSRTSLRPSVRTPSSTARTASAETGFVSEKDGGIPASLNPQVKVHRRHAVPGRVPAGGPGVLQGTSPRSTASTTRTRTPSTATRP